MTHHVGTDEHEQLGRKKSATDGANNDYSMMQAYSPAHIVGRCSSLVDGVILTSSELTVDGELASTRIRWNRTALTGRFTTKFAHYRHSTMNKIQTIMEFMK